MWPDWAILKVIGNNTSSKRSPNDCQILGYFEKPHSYVKTSLATFGKNWATLSSNIWSHCLTQSISSSLAHVLSLSLSLAFARRRSAQSEAIFMLSGRNNTLKHGHISLERTAKIIREEFGLDISIFPSFLFMGNQVSEDKLMRTLLGRPML